MNFDLSDEQLQIQRTVREFAQGQIAPVIGRHLEEDRFPTEIVRGLTGLGVMGLPYPEAYGGSGAGMLAFALALEELARVSPSVAAIVFAHSSPATLIWLNGSEAQKQRWLVPLAHGSVLGAIGLTEPSGGSDTAALQTRAEQADGGWVLNGSKTFITNTGTPLSGVAVVAAATEPDGARDRLSSFIVPADAPGFTAGRKLHKIGWRAADTCELYFEDCRLPADALLGQRGTGQRQMLIAVTYGRICVGAMAVGLAQACFDYARQYARERTAFGRPIAEFQGVSFKLVDLAIQIEAARLLTHRAAALCDAGRPFRAEASMAKLFGSEMAFEAARQAIQVHGAYGISREHPVSWLLGEAKVLEVVEGTSEIQRLLLARLLGIGP
jgi:butyryl-CoA dehydrogenase